MTSKREDRERAIKILREEILKVLDGGESEFIFFKPLNSAEYDEETKALVKELIEVGGTEEIADTVDQMTAVIFGAILVITHALECSFSEAMEVTAHSLSVRSMIAAARKQVALSYLARNN